MDSEGRARRRLTASAPAKPYGSGLRSYREDSMKSPTLINGVIIDQDDFRSPNTRSDDAVEKWLESTPAVPQETTVRRRSERLSSQKQIDYNEDKDSTLFEPDVEMVTTTITPETPAPDSAEKQPPARAKHYRTSKLTRALERHTLTNSSDIERKMETWGSPDDSFVKVGTAASGHVARGQEVGQLVMPREEMSMSGQLVEPGPETKKFGKCVTPGCCDGESKLKSRPVYRQDPDPPYDPTEGGYYSDVTDDDSEFYAAYGAGRPRMAEHVAERSVLCGSGDGDATLTGGFGSSLYGDPAWIKKVQIEGQGMGNGDVGDDGNTFLDRIRRYAQGLWAPVFYLGSLSMVYYWATKREEQGQDQDK